MYIYLYFNFNFPLTSTQWDNQMDRCDPKALQCPGESNVFTTRSNFNSILCSHWWMFQSLAWKMEKFILCPAHIVSLVVPLPFVTWSFSTFYGLGRLTALLHVVLSVWSCNSELIWITDMHIIFFVVPSHKFLIGLVFDPTQDFIQTFNIPNATMHSKA